MTSCCVSSARSLPGGMRNPCRAWRSTGTKSPHPRARAAHQTQPQRSPRLHKGHKAALIWLLAALLAPAWSQTVDAAYRAATAKFRADLLAERKEQWYPLAGLFWLQPGANRLGAGAQNDVVLP